MSETLWMMRTGSSLDGDTRYCSVLFAGRSYRHHCLPCRLHHSDTPHAPHRLTMREPREPLCYHCLFCVMRCSESASHVPPNANTSVLTAHDDTQRALALR